MFCTSRRKLDRELQVARNMNPRLRDPLPFEQQYFSTFKKTYSKRTERACDVYDVNRLARKKEDFSWYEPDMTVASSFRYKSSKKPKEALSTRAKAKKQARRVKPPSYGHRPGSAGRHFDTVSMEVTRTPATLADHHHQHLMTVEQLFVMLHSDPVPQSDVAASSLAETAPTPALAKTFKNMISSMQDVEPPKFQIGNSKPVSGGLVNRTVNSAVAKSRNRRRRRKQRRRGRVLQFEDEDENPIPEFNNRLHLGAPKPPRLLTTRKSPSNAYERVARFQRMAAGVERSPFCPQRDQFRSTTLEQNLMDHPTFLSYMTRKEIKQIISKPLEDKVQDGEEERSGEDEDDEPPPPPSDPPPTHIIPTGPVTKTTPVVEKVKGNKQKKAQLSVYDNLSMGQTYGSNDDDSDDSIGY